MRFSMGMSVKIDKKIKQEKCVTLEKVYLSIIVDYWLLAINYWL